MGRRPALAEKRCARRRHPPGGESRGRTRDALSRRRQVAGGLFAARSGARAPAPRTEERVRPVGNPESGASLSAALGFCQLLFLLCDSGARLAGKRALRIARKKPRVELDGKHRLARFACLGSRFEEQSLGVVCRWRNGRWRGGGLRLRLRYKPRHALVRELLSFAPLCTRPPCRIAEACRYEDRQHPRNDGHAKSIASRCKPNSPTSSAARRKAARPRRSCASASTAAFAPPLARATRCSATIWTARAAASIS